jgi:cysteinyl-tRNA synthetase
MVSQPVAPREPGLELPALHQALELAGSGTALRLWLLSTSYQKTLACSPESLAMWAKNQHRLQDAFVTATLGGRGEDVSPDMEQVIYKLKTTFAAALDENLDLAHFWPSLFAFAKTVNARSTKLTAAEARLVAEQLSACDRVLGFLDHDRLPLAQADWPAEAAALVARREEARKARDFALADALRDELAVMHLRPEDHPQGPRLYRL